MPCGVNVLNNPNQFAKSTAGPCRVCGSSNLTLHMAVAGETLDRCSHCGFVQVRDEPDDHTLHSIYSAAYFAHAKYRDQRALAMEHQRRLDLMARFVSEGAKVLDAGCSIGDFVYSAKTKYEMYGIDISAAAIDQAQAKNPELSDRLVAGRLENSGHANECFDAICLWDVIEHLWNPTAVVHDLLARLNPKGYLLISTPAIDAPIARMMGKYWAFMTPPEHLSFFTQKSFRLLFEDQAGATVKHFSRKGKWANMAFIGYKLGRIAPSWLPKSLLQPFNWPGVRRLNVYVPTGDVQYLAIQRLS